MPLTALRWLVSTFVFGQNPTVLLCSSKEKARWTPTAMKEGCAIEDGSAVGYLEKTQIPILRVRVRCRTRMRIMVQVRVMKG